MPQNMDRNPDARRDNQQIQDDNQTAGESVVGGQTSGDAREPAEGSRESAGGVSNRPLSEEIGRQETLPPRGQTKDDRHGRRDDADVDPVMPTGDSSLKTKI